MTQAVIGIPTVCSENMDDGAVDKLQGMVTVSWVNDDVEHAK